MRPGTTHYDLTAASSLVWGCTFHSLPIIIDSLWAHIHKIMSGRQAALNEDASVFFIQIQAYWFTNIKLLDEGKRNTLGLRTHLNRRVGKSPGSHTRVHIPEVGTWKGLLRMVCLGNLINFLDALDQRTYWDLTSNPNQPADEELRRGKVQAQRRIACQTFADFRCWFTEHYAIKKGNESVDIDKDIFQVLFPL
jgi:hypothetical protein